MTKNDINARLEGISNNAKSNWLRDDGLRRLNFWMFMCLISSYGAGYDGSLFVGLLTLKPWFLAMFDLQKGPPQATLIGVIGLSGVVGIIAGPFIGQWISDRFGRHRAMLVGSVVAVIGGILTIITLPEPTHQRNLFICARVVISLGGGMSMVAAPVLMTELSHPRQRPVVASLYQCGFFLGSVVAAWITFGTNEWFSSWAWRVPCLIQILPFVIQLAVLWWCPHSPRFLVAHGRVEEAKAVLAKYHANGDLDDPLVNFELSSIIAAVDTDKGNTSSFTDLIATRGNRWRTYIIVLLGFVTQWAGNGVISYYLPQVLASVGVTDTRTQAAFNGGLAVFNLIVSTSAALLAERLGRRLLFLTSAAGMLCSFTIITALSATFAKSANASAGKGVIAFLFIFYFFYAIALTPLAVSYPAEILPYSIRSKGMALSISTVAVALVFNIFVNPIALAAIAWKFYLVYVAVLLFFLLNVIFLFPETRGKTIEEIQVLFDGVRDSPDLPQLNSHDVGPYEGPSSSSDVDVKDDKV